MYLKSIGSNIGMFALIAKEFLISSSNCRTVKVTDTEPYYIRAVPATKASILC